MPEIVLELSLNRSSGVLAGIVASLARAGIELKSQNLQRAAKGKGGWLTVVGTGEAPEPAVLAEHLSATRGVKQLIRMTVDGEDMTTPEKSREGRVTPGRFEVPPPGNGAKHDRTTEYELDAPAQATRIEDLPILSEPGPTEDPRTDKAPTADSRTESEFESESASDRLETAQATVLAPLEEDRAATPDSTEKLAAIAMPASEEDAASALPDEPEQTETTNASTNEETEDDGPTEFGGLIRRRRRRRR